LGDAGKGSPFANRKRKRNADRGPVTSLQSGQNATEIGLLPIQPIDQERARNPEVTSVAPCLDRARADPGRGINDDECRIRDLDGRRGLAAKIGIPGRITEEEVVALPGTVE